MIRKIDSNIFSLTILKVTTFSRIRHVAITSSGNLSLGYEDKINTEIQTEEKNNADLNDI